MDAGFSDCCVGDDCSGSPADCQCDALCHEIGDCCFDIDITCPSMFTVRSHSVIITQKAAIEPLTTHTDLFHYYLFHL